MSKPSQTHPWRKAARKSMCYINLYDNATEWMVESTYHKDTVFDNEGDALDKVLALRVKNPYSEVSRRMI